MAHNNFLDLPSDSDASNSQSGYDSDAHELSKSKSSRPNKRQRLSSDKREYLERLPGLHSQDEDAESEVEEAQRNKSVRGRAPLRRPVETQKCVIKSGREVIMDSDEEDASDILGGADGSDHSEDELNVEDRNGDEDIDASDHSDSDDIEAQVASPPRRTIKPIKPTISTTAPTFTTPTSLKRKRPSTSTTPAPAPSKKLKTGVLYLPRLPPFLKPSTLRTLLTPYTRHGISRLFLTPEPHSSRIARLRLGGNRKRLFTDGWVECFSKNDAKTVAETLNGRTMGGRKGGRWRDDVWALRYLRGFKWGDLVGERRDEDAERGSRVEAERRRDRKEREVFVREVQRGKAEATRVGKAMKRREKEGAAVAGEGREVKEVKERRPHTFRQNAVIKKTGMQARGDADGGPKDEVQRVLSKIF